MKTNYLKWRYFRYNVFDRKFQNSEDFGPWAGHPSCFNVLVTAEKYICYRGLSIQNAGYNLHMRVYWLAEDPSLYDCKT